MFLPVFIKDASSVGIFPRTSPEDVTTITRPKSRPHKSQSLLCNSTGNSTHVKDIQYTVTFQKKKKVSCTVDWRGYVFFFKGVKFENFKISYNQVYSLVCRSVTIRNYNSFLSFRSPFASTLTDLKTTPSLFRSGPVRKVTGRGDSVNNVPDVRLVVVRDPDGRHCPSEVERTLILIKYLYQ